jgi:hypothetical protein
MHGTYLDLLAMRNEMQDTETLSKTRSQPVIESR